MVAKQRKFNPAKIIRARRIQEILDPDLGLIRYVTLTMDDFAEITKKCHTTAEISMEMLCRQLAPTNPGLTVKTIGLLPIDVVTRLMVTLKHSNYFLPVKPNQAAETVDLPKGDAP